MPSEMLQQATSVHTKGNIFQHVTSTANISAVDHVHVFDVIYQVFTILLSKKMQILKHWFARVS